MTKIRDFIRDQGGQTLLARRLQERVQARGPFGKTHRCYPTMVDAWARNNRVPGFWLRLLVELTDDDGKPLSRADLLDLACPEPMEG